MNLFKKLFTKKETVKPIQICTYFHNGIKQVDISIKNSKDLHAVLYFFNSLSEEIQKTLKKHPDCSVRISPNSWLSGGQLKLETFQESNKELKD